MKLLTNDIFRRNMKEIIRDPVLIDSVTNSIDPLDDVTNKLSLKKRWPLFRKQFIEIYGTFPKKLTASDIIDSMLSFLNKDIDITNKTQEEIQETILIKKQFDSKAEIQSNFYPQQLADDSGNHIFVLIVEVIKNKYKILYSFSGNEDTFIELTNDNIALLRDDYLNNTGNPFNIDYLFNNFNAKNKSKLAKAIQSNECSFKPSVNKSAHHTRNTSLYSYSTKNHQHCTSRNKNYQNQKTYETFYSSSKKNSSPHRKDASFSEEKKKKIMNVLKADNSNNNKTSRSDSKKKSVYKVSLSELSERMLVQKRTDSFKKVFALLDSNSDGKISSDSIDLSCTTSIRQNN